MKQLQFPLQVKVLAPAATKTEFGEIANGVDNYNYDKAFGTYHSSEEVAQFLLELYDSNKIVGIVDRATFKFELQDNIFPFASNNGSNQTLD